jgi:ABC-type transporter Mla subunit MlaD
MFNFVKNLKAVKMANVRNLKKDINYVLGDIIEAVYVWEYANKEKGTKESEAIIDEAIAIFDDLIAKVNAKTDNAKAHFKAINAELESKGLALIEKINNLG